MPAETAQTAANMPPPRGIDAQRALAIGRDVLATEAAAIHALESRLGGAFLAAARMLFGCRGRVVVTGIGKSGHIARKLAATLASTGTPVLRARRRGESWRPGTITADDVVLMLNPERPTSRLADAAPCGRSAAIALTGNEQSPLRGISTFTSTPASMPRRVHSARAHRQHHRRDRARRRAGAHAARRADSVEISRACILAARSRRLLTRVSDDAARRGAACGAGRDARTGSQNEQGIKHTAVIDADTRVVGIFTDGTRAA
jgi:arabinose-5-phosphate isomerase